MRGEYNIEELNPRKNPYSNRMKKQVTLNLNVDTIEYFKALSQQNGIPYQTLINMYLTDCAEKQKKLQIAWK